MYNTINSTISNGKNIDSPSPNFENKNSQLTCPKKSSDIVIS